MTVRWTFAALGSLAALAGCTFMEGLTQTAPPPEPSAPVAEVAPEVPTPERKPKPPLQAALPSPTTPQAAPPIEATQLEQMTPEQTTELLGEPTYRSERGSGIVWSYVRPGCELDLVFFMNVQTKVSRVLDYDLRAGDGSDRSRQRCLEQFALDRQSRGSGSSSRPR